MPYVCHPHVHDEGSPVDGAGNSNQLSYEAVRKGQTHLCRTNHGRLTTSLEHVHACRHPEKYDNPLDPSKKRSSDERLHPILGIEAYWRPDRFMDLTDKDTYGKVPHNWAQHLCVHARTLRGWRTLMRLSSKSWVRREQGGGYYGKPCFDWDMIENDHEDIVIGTACMSSPVSQLLIGGYYEEARQWCIDMMEIVGERNFFFEVMPHDIDEQREINIGKINLANELGRPFIASGDVHIPYKKWADTHNLMWMISTKQTVSKREKAKEAGEEVYGTHGETLYLSSGFEMRKMFKKYHPDMSDDHIKEALNNSSVFARRFEPFVIGKTLKMPKITHSVYSAERILRKWAEGGFTDLKQKWRAAGLHPVKIKQMEVQYRQRFEDEFAVLKRKNSLDYFILVGGLVRWLKSDAPLPGDKQKKRPVRVGCRGSAAGCLVSRLIGISAMNPVSWGLLFERFLNEDREGMPDIDLDIETEVVILVVDGVEMDGRALAKEYLKRKHGKDHVADIIAFQTFAPRAVIDAVSATQEFPFKEIEAIKDSIGDTERILQKIQAGNPLVAKYAEDHPWAWDQCLRLEDQIMRDTRHAGGVLVVGPHPVDYYMPTQLGTDEKTTVTAWSDRMEFPIISDYGFTKIDVLGVKGLGKQALACEMIREHYGVDFEPNDLPALDNPYAVDQRVIDGFVMGITKMVFQFPGAGITDLLRKMKPDNAMDISVANALYRPGPIDIAFEYADRKNDRTPITFWHESLEPILGETLGLMCFQEQAMEVVKQLAGFSGTDADNFRKIMSKLYRLPGDKAQQVMRKDRDRFIHGCMTISGLREQDAIYIFDDRMLPLGNYLFNKSHSSWYGLQAYQDMHIKIHFPLAFYASGLTIEHKAKKDEQEQFIRGVLREAKVLGVEALPPSVNRSSNGWSIDGNSIRFGLVSVKEMGNSAANDLRERMPYISMKDYMRRIPSSFQISQTVSLAKAGAFDELAQRRELLARVRNVPHWVARFKVKMDCGHPKQKTVKLKDYEGLSEEEIFEALDVASEKALADLRCKHHPEARMKDYEHMDPYYTVLEYAKLHNGEWPEEPGVPPDENDILDYEVDSLGIALSQTKLIQSYHPYLESKIFTELEVEKLPAKPDRTRKNGKQVHGWKCVCKDCRVAFVVVGGEIINVKVIKTRNGDKMAFVDAAFGASQYNLTFFPYGYKLFHEALSLPGIFLFRGYKDKKGSIIVNDMVDAIEAAKEDGFEPDNTVVSLPKRAPRPKKIIRRRKVVA